MAESTRGGVPADQGTLQKDETSNLISSEKVRGTEVYGRNGEHLGEVEHLMVDKHSGKVAYAVVAFGGFLGLGGERRALPWQVLSYDFDLDGYVVGAENDVLRNAPMGGGDREYDDREWRDRVYSHFGVAPYWH